MKICVFVSDNRPLDPVFDGANYHTLVSVINQAYCKKHGYDFIYYKPYLHDESSASIFNCLDPNNGAHRHASWSKLLSAKKALEGDYDYVVCIDSDCIFRNFDISLEKFIEPLADKDVIFLNNKPWGDHLPCGGFFVCKNSDGAKTFLNDWYNFNIPAKNKDHMWEQAALWEIYTRYNLGIVDAWMFKEDRDQFLRHIGSYVGHTRVPYFSEFITRWGLDFPGNRAAIKVVSYNTASC